MTDELTARVRAYILQHALIAAGDTVIVAVSGGADSLCLLSLLHVLAPELGCRLHVAHLDHALRTGSGADAAFVAARAAELGLTCAVERRDVRALARTRRLSLETAARAARYEFLREVARTTGAAVIATGHTRDDQAETLLLHLARGSGLHGLAGMAPRRDGVIRPLLEVSRAETEAYCAALGLEPRDDESNRSATYRRNRVRHEALPCLEAIQPAASANIARAARLLSADLALVERLAQSALNRAIITRDRGRVTLSAARWAEAESELRPHLLRLLLESLLGHADGFTERHYAAMTAVLEPAVSGSLPRLSGQAQGARGRRSSPACSDKGPSSLSLPHGLVLARHGDAVTLGPPIAPPAALGEYVLAVPGVARTAAGTMRAEYTDAPCEWSSVPAHVAYLNGAAAGGSLTVRGWRPGDRVRPLGLVGTRKVQDVFVDRKAPRALRHTIPIVVGARGIAWVTGLCVGEPYRATPGRAAVRLIWEPAAPS